MKLLNWCQKLLPGNEFMGTAFSDQQFAEWVRRFPDSYMKVNYEWSLFYDVLTPEEKEMLPVSKFMDHLKQKNYRLWNCFRVELLTIYFSNPEVLQSLNSSKEPLYPRGQVLPEIDYQLLEEIYERGPIWLNVEQEALKI